MQKLALLMERWRPGITAEFKPTSEADIRKIEVVAGGLPGAYVRFLRTMGACMDPLVIDHGNADLRSREKWRVYEDQDWLAGRFVYLGQDSGPNGSDYFLDRESPHGLDDCMVIGMPIEGPFDARYVCQIHAGLEEMLYYEAFLQFRLPLFAHHCGLVQPRVGEDPALWPQPDAFYALAEKLGFKRIPPATRSALFERGDAALLVYQTPIEPVFRAILVAETEESVYRVSTAFVDAIGVTKDPDPLFY